VGALAVVGVGELKNEEVRGEHDLDASMPQNVRSLEGFGIFNGLEFCAAELLRVWNFQLEKNLNPTERSEISEISKILKLIQNNSSIFSCFN
jgi:hypothetical protein